MLSSFGTELFRIPVEISPYSLLLTAAITATIAISAGVLVRRRLVRSDPVAVLKTRE
jgi:ABC-type antimicrobial peptide transport system permease subunit